LRSEKERTDNYTTNVWARAARPLDRLFTNLGDNMEKERRTFTSWLLPADFTDLNGFTTKLASAQDPVSKFILEQLRPGTRQLLGKGDQKQLRQALADDLNVLINRELKAKNEGKTVESLYTAERF